MYLSLIIPAYNEEKRILKTLSEIGSSFKNKSFEIIVVCNGCTDNTCALVKKNYKKNTHIRVYSIRKAAKGSAILFGFKKARGKIIGFIDADNPFGINGIKKVLSAVETGKVDCAIASKWPSGKRFSNTPESFRRKIGSLGWNLLIKNLLGLKIKDTQAGTKFLTKKALAAIDKNFICNGFEFDIELLFKLKKKGFRIKEICLPLKESEYTTFKIQKIPRMFLNLIKLWLKYI